MTITPATSVAQIIEGAEDATRERSIDFATQLKRARLEVNKFEGLFEDAEDAFADLTARLSIGDETVTVAAFAKAKAAVERAELLRQSPTNIVDRLVKRQISMNVEMAEAAAGALAPIFPGVQIFATFAEVNLSDTGSPVLVVSQTQSPTEALAGLLDGEVTVTLYRTLTERELDASRIEKAMSEASHIGRVTVGRVNTRRIGDAEAFKDEVKLKLRSSHAPIPLVRTEPDSERAVSVGSLVSGALADVLKSNTAALRAARLDGLGYTRDMGAKVETISTKLVSNAVDDGLRTTVVEVVHTFVPGAGNNTSHAGAKAAIESTLGAFEPGAGVVSHVDVVSMSRREKSVSSTSTTRVTLRSKTV